MDIIIGALFGLLVFLAVIILSSRLLGVRQSWWRMLAAGFLGIALGGGFANATGVEHLDSGVGIPLVFFASILVAIMGLSVLFELLVLPSRAGSAQAIGRRGPGMRGIPRPLRTTRRRMARGYRYVQIMGIIARYGLSPYFRRRRSAPVTGPLGNSRSLWARVRGALEEAGGAFVKFGQVLSTRPDLLPPQAIVELAELQDGVLPVPYKEIEALLIEELGARPADIFADFDVEPLAAASIAQVYRARLASGEQVVVKVQRPGVRELVERDLDILLNMAHTLEARAAWARAFNVVGLAAGFAEALREELDFRVEARNISAVAAAQAAQDMDGSDARELQAVVRIPHVFPRLSTGRVLVIEWLDGVSVRDAGPLVEQLGLSRLMLARELLRCMLRQVLRDGTFHADPHPGNVLVLRDGRLALIDFGSVGRLDPLQQSALQRMLIALERHEATLLTDALLDIAQMHEEDGEVGQIQGQGRATEEQIERALAHFMAQRLGPGMSAGPELFVDLFQVLLDFGLAFPPVVGGVFRALVTLQGTLALLAPDFQMVDEARAMGAEWAQESLGPASLHKTATDELLLLLPMLRRLPRRLDRLAAAAERGSLSVNVRLFADERDTRFVSRLVSRVVLAFLGAALGLMAVLLLGLKGGPALSTSTSVYQAFGYFGLFVSIVLILRVVIAIVRERSG